MDELNKKLAEWAGFIEMEDIYKGNRYTVGWEYPDDSELGKLPNFTKSLDACFKWLVPKLYKQYINPIELKVLCPLANCPDFWVVDISTQHESIESANGKSFALAFCLALEKLIDSEERSNG